MKDARVVTLGSQTTSLRIYGSHVSISHDISFLDGLLGLICLIYLVMLAVVFAKRRHPGVQSRSPKLILVGGVALMLDSVLNFVIQVSEDDSCQCFIGIFTTVTNHYIAWLSIFLRAFRIGRFFDTYEAYLKQAE